MDPLSLSASIAGLISLADAVFTAVFKYGRAVKNSRTDVEKLADEINGLSTILRSLQALVVDLESEEDVYDPTLRAHYLHQFSKTLAKIEQRVQNAIDSFKRSKLDGITRQLKWPFSAGETKELLEDLSRHKATITVVLSADSMRKMQLSLSKDVVLAKEVSVMAEVLRRIEINTQISLEDKQRLVVLDYFMKISPQQNLEMSIKLRQPMTGLWLTGSSRFFDWLEHPGSKLWLNGIPGAGKTVLAGSVIQEALTRSYISGDIGVGFFFCDYKNESTWSPVNVLGALASQLARQKTEAFAILQEYYDQLHPQKGLEQTPDPEELRAKIGHMSELFAQTIIVIDGLDECGDITGDVVEVLQELATNHTNISMALFSRNHDDIRFRLEPKFEHIQIAAYTEDIKLYVGAELDKRIRERRLQLSSVAMKDEISKALVERADGMFRWVVCQIDYLCECAHDAERREALERLPPDLPEGYRRLLVRANQSSASVQNMVRKCLLFIAYAQPKLKILELRQAISTPDVVGALLDESNAISEHEISRSCSSLIRKSQDGQYFEFAHFSVQEFLEDETALLGSKEQPTLNKYTISRQIGEKILAAQCLMFILLKNFDEPPSSQKEAESMARARNDAFPFYNKAAIG